MINFNICQFNLNFILSLHFLVKISSEIQKKPPNQPASRNEKVAGWQRMAGLEEQFVLILSIGE